MLILSWTFNSHTHRCISVLLLCTGKLTTAAGEERRASESFDVIYETIRFIRKGFSGIFHCLRFKFFRISFQRSRRARDWSDSDLIFLKMHFQCARSLVLCAPGRLNWIGFDCEIFCFYYSFVPLLSPAFEFKSLIGKRCAVETAEQWKETM